MNRAYFKSLATVIALVMTVAAFASCGIDGKAQGITGNVYDKVYGDKLPFLKIIATSLDDKSVETATANQNGDFSIGLDPGKYRFEILDERPDFKYTRFVQGINVEQGKWFKVDAGVDPVVKTFVHGQVLDKDTKIPLPNATIMFNDAKRVTDKNGKFEFKYIRPGNTFVKVEVKGYAPLETYYTISEGETIEDFSVIKSIDLDNVRIKNIHDILSYKVSIALGTTNENITSSTTITINNLPFAMDIESPKGSGRYVIGNAYISNKGKLEKATEKAFESLKNEYYEFDKLIKAAIDQFNEQKIKENKLDTIEVADFVTVPYKYSLSYENSKYDATIYIIFEGPNKGYPVKLTLSKPGFYKDITISTFNDPENILTPPK